MNVLMRRWIAAALIVAPVAWPALAGPPEDAIAAQEKRIQELEAEQARLKAEIEQIRKQQAPMPSPTPILTAPTPVSDRTPIPKTIRDGACGVYLQVRRAREAGRDP